MDKNRDTFQVRAWSKADLARLYNPDKAPHCAARIFTRWIHRNPALSRRLSTLGVTPRTRSYTPRQVHAIVEILGEP